MATCRANRTMPRRVGASQTILNSCMNMISEEAKMAISARPIQSTLPVCSSSSAGTVRKMIGMANTRISGIANMAVQDT